MKHLIAFAGLGLVLLPLHSAAVPKYYKHDQFSQNIASAAEDITALELQVLPSFAKGEAFGQMFVPDPGDYPITITGVDLFLGAPPLDSNPSGVHVDIEIYNGVGSGPQPPASAKKFVINSSEVMVEGGLDAGKPWKGGSAIPVDFDPGDPDGAPDVVYSGNIWFMIRFINAGTAGDSEWGPLTCSALPCGCQAVASIHDDIYTPHANILHIFDPTFGGCDQPATTWAWLEDLTKIPGDIVMRLRANVSGCAPDCSGKQCGSDGCGGVCPDLCTATQHCVGNACVEDGPCVPQCAGKVCGSDGCQGTCGTCGGDSVCVDGACCTPDCSGAVCGSDGCGGSCGSCASGETCESGACVPGTCQPACAGKECGSDGCQGTCGQCEAGEVCEAGLCVPEGAAAVTVTNVSPAFGFDDRSTDISIAGTGFQAGVTVRLGAEPLGVLDRIGTTLVEARVPEGLATGVYTLHVINPDDSTAFLADAFEVRAADTGSQTYSKSKGCAATGAEAPPLLGLLGGLAWALARRRRRVA